MATAHSMTVESNLATDPHAPFLATICERADEDGPRLVWADFLEEQGDSDRSELIRVQVELANTPMPCFNPTLHSHGCRACALRARSVELLAAYGRIWAAPLRAVLPKCEACNGDGTHVDSRLIPREFGGMERLNTRHQCRLCRGSGSPVAVEWSRGFVEALRGRPCVACDGRGYVGIGDGVDVRNVMGDCPACHRTGRTGGVDAAAWVVSHCHRLQEFSAGHGFTGRGACDVCGGRGTLPGLAAAVARLIPLRSVEFAGKRPHLAAAGDYYFWVDVGTTVTREDATARLPPQLFEQLEGGFVGMTGFRYYPTVAAAVLALSNAGVAFARGLAGLPPLAAGETEV